MYNIAQEYSEMANYLNKIPAFIKNKYNIAIVIFLLFILVFDDNNIFYQYKLYREQKKLESISASLKLKINDLRKLDAELHKNKLAIEKIAREKYGMKKENETVFLVPDTK
jgi:cell division protein FtsB